MANVNAPFGFRPISTLGGGPLSVREYAKPTSVNAIIYRNDLVTKAATEVANPMGVGNPLPGITNQSITPGTTYLLGATLNYSAAAIATVHYVTDQIDVIYQAQVDADGSTDVQVSTCVGKNGNVLLTAGSSTTKQSANSIDGSTINTTADLDARILKLWDVPSNVEGLYAIVEVIIVKHILGQNTAGV